MHGHSAHMNVVKHTIAWGNGSLGRVVNLRCAVAEKLCLRPQDMPLIGTMDIEASTSLLLAFEGSNCDVESGNTEIIRRPCCVGQSIERYLFDFYFRALQSNNTPSRFQLMH
jgi:hypothetical protein